MTAAPWLRCPGAHRAGPVTGRPAGFEEPRPDQGLLARTYKGSAMRPPSFQERSGLYASFSRRARRRHRSSIFTPPSKQNQRPPAASANCQWLEFTRRPHEMANLGTPGHRACYSPKQSTYAGINRTEGGRLRAKHTYRSGARDGPGWVRPGRAGSGLQGRATASSRRSLIKEVKPIYTKSAMDREVRGSGRARCGDPQDGTVGDVTVTKSLDDGSRSGRPSRPRSSGRSSRGRRKANP